MVSRATQLLNSSIDSKQMRLYKDWTDEERNCKQRKPNIALENSGFTQFAKQM